MRSHTKKLHESKRTNKKFTLYTIVIVTIILALVAEYALLTNVL